MLYKLLWNKYNSQVVWMSYTVNKTWEIPGISPTFLGEGVVRHLRHTERERERVWTSKEIAPLMARKHTLTLTASGAKAAGDCR